MENLERKLSRISWELQTQEQMRTNRTITHFSLTKKWRKIKCEKSKFIDLDISKQNYIDYLNSEYKDFLHQEDIKTKIKNEIKEMDNLNSQNIAVIYVIDEKWRYKKIFMKYEEFETNNLKKYYN